MRITVDSVAALRESLVSHAWAMSRRVTVEVASWERPYEGWSASLGPLPGVRTHDVRLPSGGAGRVVVRVALAEPLPFHLVGAAVLRALEPTTAQPEPVSADVAAYGAIPTWLPPSTNVAGHVGGAPDQDIIRPYDVLLETDGTGVRAPTVEGVPHVPAEAWGLDGVVLVDAATANPRGYAPPLGALEGSVDATLTVSDGQWVLRAAGRALCGGRLTVGPLDEHQIQALRAIRSVTANGLVGDPYVAHLLVRLAMTGLVLLGDSLPAAVVGLLAGELVEILGEAPPAVDAPPADWELRSVRQRRAALRHHATGIALSLPLGTRRLPSVSAVLAVTRPDLSAFAALAAQTYPALETVIAMHGCTMPERVVGRHPIDVVDVPAHVSSAEALEVATAWARGSLVVRVDSDHAYGPEHVWDLVLARHYSGARVVWQAEPGARSEIYTDRASSSAIMVARADLGAAGGWRGIAQRGYQTHCIGVSAR